MRRGLIYRHGWEEVLIESINIVPKISIVQDGLTVSVEQIKEIHVIFSEYTSDGEIELDVFVTNSITSVRYFEKN